MNKKIVTRMPPSPTGHLHIGTARTALFNYLFAKHHGGTMVFRSEDTDSKRSTREYEQEIVDGLRWLGIEWSNEKIIRQSERGELYTAYLTKLLDSGTAFVSVEDSIQNPGEKIEVIRLKNPNKTIRFTDLIRGEISFDTTELGDFVIARSINDALYHFTVVVDDFEMGVTHILRGEDHISNTPRQILIQEALGFPRPEYAHLPLILAPDRSKMSKRHGAVSLNEYIADGFLKEAIINYLVLLGWNPGDNRELFTLEELIRIFDINKINKSGAIFNIEKFLWINRQYLDTLPEDAFLNYVRTALPERLRKSTDFSEDRLHKLLPVIRERISSAKEIRELAEAGEYDFVFFTPEADPKLLMWKKDSKLTDVLPRLKRLKDLLSGTDFTNPEHIKTTVWEYAEEEGRGEVLWPFRVALTGKAKSPDPFICAYILGEDETLRRIEKACDRITMQ